MSFWWCASRAMCLLFHYLEMVKNTLFLCSFRSIEFSSFASFRNPTIDSWIFYCGERGITCIDPVFGVAKKQNTTIALSCRIFFFTQNRNQSVSFCSILKILFKMVVFCFCGERGIRTLVTLGGKTVFETVPFNHSGISPKRIAKVQIAP